MSNKHHTRFLQFLSILVVVFMGVMITPTILPGPAHGALVGTVCIAPQGTSTSGCPGTPATITGTVGATVTVAINIQDSDGLNGFHIYVKTDPNILNPVSADLTNSLLSANSLLLSKCVNGSGTNCDPNNKGLGVVEVGAVDLAGLTLPPVTGGLFEIVYSVVANSAGSPIAFLTGACGNGSSVSGLCITITNGGTNPTPETAQAGTFQNLGFAISASLGFLPVTVGAPSSSIINVTGFSGLGGQGLTVGLTENPNVTSNIPSITLLPNRVTLTTKNPSATSTLTISATASQVGGYSITVTATSGTETHTIFVIAKVTASPGLTTQLSSTSIVVGQSISDSASLSQHSPTAGGAVTYTLAATKYCNGTAVTVVQQPVTSGIVPSSGNIIINATGDFSFSALYSGDVNNTAAASQCEPFTVARAGPTLVTSFSPTTVIVGNSVRDTATIANGFFGASNGVPFSHQVGNVTYSLFTGSSTCSGTPARIGFFNINETSGSVPQTRPVLFNSTGTVSWNATFSGDENNMRATTCEPLTIRPVTPTITTALSSTKIGLGDSASDTATLSGAYLPTGTVSYYLFESASGHGTGGCTGTAHLISSFNVIGNGPQTTSGLVTFNNNTATEIFGWNAIYSGDFNNTQATSGCELLTVTTVPDFDISSTSSLTFRVGSTANLDVTLTGINSFTGTVTLTNSTSPSTGLGLICNPNPVSVTTTPTVSTCTFSASSSNIYAVTITGTSSSLVHSVSVSITVTKASPTLPTVLSISTITLNSGTQTATDKATLTGGFNPTGTISFQVFGPSNAICAGTGNPLGSPLPISGNGDYSSSVFTPQTAGKYNFVVRYSGDGNNTAVTTSCTAEILTVQKAVTSILTQLFNATDNKPLQLSNNLAVIKVGTGIYDNATISGAFDTPTGTVSFTLYSGKQDCTGTSQSFSIAVSATKSFSIFGSPDMPSLSMGNYSIRAAYDGDVNNAGSPPSNCLAITANAPPIASFAISSPRPYLIGQNLKFNATSSNDPDSTSISDTIISYSWSLGEGQPVTGLLVSHSYNTPGNYIVTLTVTDKYGASDTATQTVRVDSLIVSISSVPSTTSTSVGTKVSFTVDVNNSGTLGLNFTVTLDVNGISVAKKPLTLTGGQDSGSFTLSWDTTSYNAGSYNATVRIAGAKTLGTSPAPVSVPAGPESSQITLTAVNQAFPLPGGPIPWVILAVVVIAGVAGYMLFRRRSKTQTI